MPTDYENGHGAGTRSDRRVRLYVNRAREPKPEPEPYRTHEEKLLMMEPSERNGLVKLPRLRFQTNRLPGEGKW